MAGVQVDHHKNITFHSPVPETVAQGAKSSVQNQAQDFATQPNVAFSNMCHNDLNVQKYTILESY